MSSSQITPSDTGTYDIIFAGGGATACVTAGRLAQADPSLKILVLEAGPHTRELPIHIQPARYLRNLLLPTQTFSYHVAKPSEYLAGRSVIVSTGRCLGGGSSVNSVAYTRAAASDYDDWENQFGNKGWSSRHLIPLLKKAETYQEAIENNTHGTTGPLKISYARENVNLAENFLEVANAYDKDHKQVKDLNDFNTCNGYARWARYIDTETGRRSDTPHHYIYNRMENSNLSVKDRQRVIRVIFEGTRAIGVEYVDDLIGRNKGTQKPTVAFASRMVVVSAGAFGSPAILERSGIGAADVLRKNDINQLVDLPGVGDHYMDHNLVFPAYFASEDADTLDSVFRDEESEIQSYVTHWLDKGKGLMSHNGLDAGIKLRPTDAELSEMGPSFEQRWKTYFANAHDKPVMLMGMYSAYAGKHPEAAKWKKYYSVVYFSGYPSSTGSVHITSGLDPYGALDFEPGYLKDDGDVVILRWAYKRARELARRSKFYRGEFIQDHPQFAKGSAATTGSAIEPVEISAPDIVYSAEDDAAIDEYHRKNVETTWHSIGTCAMKPRAQGGVVDERLNVYGVQNLKVADCSIAPGNVGANTYNTALAIGEKAAFIIAEDLGIKGVTAA